LEEADLIIAENLENMLQMLSFDWMQEDWIADCDEGTCQWIFDNEEWKMWLHEMTPGRSPLWISGSPGMGKTVLSKFIAKELRQSKTSMYTLSYFFDESISIRSTFKGLLCSLLHQLLTLDKELLSHLHTRSESTSEPLSTSALLKCLSTIFQDADFNGAIIIIDAIDECTDPEMLLKFIRELSRQRIHLVITSKPEKRPRLDNFFHIPLNGADSSKTAVREYLKNECHRVLPLPKINIDEFQVKFESSINQSKHLTFLWIRLAVRLIAMQISLKECRRELKTLLGMEVAANHDNMSALMKRYLNQAFTPRKNIPIEILYVLIVAKAPISIAGLSFFAAAILEPGLLEPEEILDDVTEEDVWEQISSVIDENIPIKFEEQMKMLALVEVREDAVSLMHDSLRHILPSMLLPTATEKNHWPTFTATEFHFLVAQICLSYIIFALQAGSDRYNMLKYAYLYWFEHILAAKDIDPNAEIPESLEKVIGTFFRTVVNDTISSRSSESFDNTILRKWLVEYNNHDGSLERQFLSKDEHVQFSERGLTFAVLAAFDLFPALHFLVPDLTDEDFSRPLSKNSDNPVSLNSLLIGNDSIRSLEWLHGSRAVTCISNWLTTYPNNWRNLELTDRYLELIAQSGSPASVDFFINAFRMNEELLIRLASFHQRTARKGHDEVFLILYQRILSRHMEDGDTPNLDHIQQIAESAAELDLLKLVTELLQKWKLSPERILFHAIQAGAEKTSEHLISRSDVNVDESYGPNGSILHIASSAGSRNIVNALLRRGCRINAMDDRRRIPLHIACQSGNLDVCKLLLNMHEISLLNYADDENMLPLHYAADLCHAHIISLLLEEGSNVFAADKEGRAPLHLVCQQGSYSTAKILLEYGARVEVKDKVGRTPLHYAAISANVELVWLLIGYGASDSARDDDGASPLHRASTRISDVMVKRLVELGSDPNAEDDKGHTPLYYLFYYSESPSRAVFEALMNHGAILNIRDVGHLHNYAKWLEPYKGTGKIVEESSNADDAMLRYNLTQRTWTDEDSPETSYYSAQELY
jgi:ankyrin repeat protein